MPSAADHVTTRAQQARSNSRKRTHGQDAPPLRGCASGRGRGRGGAQRGGGTPGVTTRSAAAASDGLSSATSSARRGLTAARRGRGGTRRQDAQLSAVAAAPHADESDDDPIDSNMRLRSRAPSAVAAASSRSDGPSTSTSSAARGAPAARRESPPRCIGSDYFRRGMYSNTPPGIGRARRGRGDRQRGISFRTNMQDELARRGLEESSEESGDEESGDESVGAAAAALRDGPSTSAAGNARTSARGASSAYTLRGQVSIQRGTYQIDYDYEDPNDADYAETAPVAGGRNRRGRVMISKRGGPRAPPTRASWPDTFFTCISDDLVQHPQALAEARQRWMVAERQPSPDPHGEYEYTDYSSDEAQEPTRQLISLNPEDPIICAVCQDDDCPKRHYVRLTGCRHFAHRHCITKYFAERKKHNRPCPLCRGTPKYLQRIRGGKMVHFKTPLAEETPKDEELLWSIGFPAADPLLDDWLAKELRDVRDAGIAEALTAYNVLDVGRGVDGYYDFLVAAIRSPDTLYDAASEGNKWLVKNKSEQTLDDEDALSREIERRRDRRRALEQPEGLTPIHLARWRVWRAGQSEEGELTPFDPDVPTEEELREQARIAREELLTMPEGLTSFQQLIWREWRRLQPEEGDITPWDRMSCWDVPGDTEEVRMKRRAQMRRMEALRMPRDLTPAQRKHFLKWFAIAKHETGEITPWDRNAVPDEPLDGEEEEEEEVPMEEEEDAVVRDYAGNEVLDAEYAVSVKNCGYLFGWKDCFGCAGCKEKVDEQFEIRMARVEAAQLQMLDAKKGVIIDAFAAAESLPGTSRCQDDKRPAKRGRFDHILEPAGPSNRVKARKERYPWEIPPSERDAVDEIPPWDRAPAVAGEEAVEEREEHQELPMEEHDGVAAGAVEEQPENGRASPRIEDRDDPFFVSADNYAESLLDALEERRVGEDEDDEDGDKHGEDQEDVRVVEEGGEDGDEDGEEEEEYEDEEDLEDEEDEEYEDAPPLPGVQIEHIDGLMINVADDTFALDEDDHDEPPAGEEQEERHEEEAPVEPANPLPGGGIRRSSHGSMDEVNDAEERREEPIVEEEEDEDDLMDSSSNHDDDVDAAPVEGEEAAIEIVEGSGALDDGEEQEEEEPEDDMGRQRKAETAELAASILQYRHSQTDQSGRQKGGSELAYYDAYADAGAPTESGELPTTHDVAWDGPPRGRNMEDVDTAATAAIPTVQAQKATEAAVGASKESRPPAAMSLMAVQKRAAPVIGGENSRLNGGAGPSRDDTEVADFMKSSGGSLKLAGIGTAHAQSTSVGSTARMESGGWMDGAGPSRREVARVMAAEVHGEHLSAATIDSPYKKAVEPAVGTSEDALRHAASEAAEPAREEQPEEEAEEERQGEDAEKMTSADVYTWLDEKQSIMERMAHRMLGYLADNCITEDNWRVKECQWLLRELKREAKERHKRRAKGLCPDNEKWKIACATSRVEESIRNDREYLLCYYSVEMDKTRKFVESRNAGQVDAEEDGRENEGNEEGVEDGDTNGDDSEEHEHGYGVNGDDAEEQKEEREEENDDGMEDSEQREREEVGDEHEDENGRLGEEEEEEEDEENYYEEEAANRQLYDYAAEHYDRLNLWDEGEERIIIGELEDDPSLAESFPEKYGVGAMQERRRATEQRVKVRHERRDVPLLPDDETWDLFIVVLPPVSAFLWRDSFRQNGPSSRDEATDVVAPLGEEREENAEMVDAEEDRGENEGDERGPEDGFDQRDEEGEEEEEEEGEEANEDGEEGGQQGEGDGEEEEEGGGEEEERDEEGEEERKDEEEEGEEEEEGQEEDGEDEEEEEEQEDEDEEEGEEEDDNGGDEDGNQDGEGEGGEEEEDHDEGGEEEDPRDEEEEKAPKKRRGEDNDDVTQRKKRREEEDAEVERRKRKEEEEKKERERKAAAAAAAASAARVSRPPVPTHSRARRYSDDSSPESPAPRPRMSPLDELYNKLPPNEQRKLKNAIEFPKYYNGEHEMIKEMAEKMDREEAEKKERRKKREEERAARLRAELAELGPPPEPPKEPEPSSSTLASTSTASAQPPAVPIEPGTGLVDAATATDPATDQPPTTKRRRPLLSSNGTPYPKNPSPPPYEEIHIDIDSPTFTDSEDDDEDACLLVGVVSPKLGVITEARRAKKAEMEARGEVYRPRTSKRSRSRSRSDSPDVEVLTPPPKLATPEPSSSTTLVPPRDGPSTSAAVHTPKTLVPPRDGPSTSAANTPKTLVLRSRTAAVEKAAEKLPELTTYQIDREEKEKAEQRKRMEEERKRQLALPETRDLRATYDEFFDNNLLFCPVEKKTHLTALLKVAMTDPALKKRVIDNGWLPNPNDVNERTFASTEMQTEALARSPSRSRSSSPEICRHGCVSKDKFRDLAREVSRMNGRLSDLETRQQQPSSSRRKR